jgi:hypothetical protein
MPSCAELSLGCQALLRLRREGKEFNRMMLRIRQGLDIDET